MPALISRLLARAIDCVSSLALTTDASAHPIPVGDNHVYVNGVALSDEALRMLAQHYGLQARPGRYWYDNVSGGVGNEGDGLTGFLPAGLRLGGTLRADASRGTSGVFFNSRELTFHEVASLQRLVPVERGRYWLDLYGNAGPEGGPATVNLAQVLRQAQGMGGGVSGPPGVDERGEYGPFATGHRAQEEANSYIARGYVNTIWCHNGDGYYVFVR